MASDDDPNGDYVNTETIFIKMSGERAYDLQIEHFDDMLNDNSIQSSWAGLDSQLIDDDLLLLEPEEADNIYMQLKKRQMRRGNMEETEQMLLNRIKEIEEIAAQNKIPNTPTQPNDMTASSDTIKQYIKNFN